MLRRTRHSRHQSGLSWCWRLVGYNKRMYLSLFASSLRNGAFKFGMFLSRGILLQV